MSKHVAALALLTGLLAGCPETLDDEGSGSTQGKIRGTLTFGVATSSALVRLTTPPGPPSEKARELLGAAKIFSDPRVRTTRDGPALVRGDVLVKMDAARMPAGDVLERVRMAGYRFEHRAQVTPRWHLLHAKRDDGKALTEPETREAVAQVAKLSRVSGAEANRIAYALATPSDPHFKYQWHFSRMQLPAAWDLGVGSESVVVAVVDSGVLAGHPDLQGRLLQGYDMIGNVSNAGDGDGRDADPTDEGGDEPNGGSSYHGTHVAGTIGAASDNGRGVAGVDWRCRVLPVRVLGREGGTSADIAAGIAWAIGLPVDGVPANAHPAQVVNLSLGGDGAASQVLQDIIDEGIQKGAVFVVAAGNEDEDTANKFPANQQHVIAVGAVGYAGTRASYSNFGDEVDVMAPGGEMAEDADGDGYGDGVLSTHADSDSGALGYGFLQGTSMAAPHVAGLAALMKSASGSLSPAQIETAIKQTAVAAFRCAEGCGSGLVDAYAALIQARGQTPGGSPQLYVPSAEIALGSNGRGAITFSNRGGGTLSVRATANGALASRASFPSGNSGSAGAGQANVIEVAVDTSGLEDGEHAISVGLDAGSAGSATVRIVLRIGTSGSDRLAVVAAVYLDDAGEWQLGGGSELRSGQTVDYLIEDLAPREYVVLAGVDDNGNGEVFDDGERIGFFRNLDSIEAVEVEAGETTKGIDFALVATSTPGEDTQPVTVGAPCESKADCGSGGLCDTTMPGGYCYKECPNGSSDCPLGADCFGTSSPVCLATCNDPWEGQSSCRSGYLCWGATPSPACFPPCDDTSCNEGAYCDSETGYCTRQ